MQVPEDPGFYVPTPPKGGNEYAHIGSLDGSDADHVRFPATQSKRYGSYIVRAPPSSKGLTTHSNIKAPSGMRHHSGRRPPRPQREHKHLKILDPLVEESLHRSLSQQNRLSCMVTPTKAKSRRSSTTPPSEIRERRTLSRFTKQLERYCVAASTNGRVPLPPSTPTVSESPTTLDTVIELLPYHKQFKVAGLAVTSREQMPRIPESAHPQLPERHAGRVRGTHVAAVQIDGSTVTPSDQASAAREPPAPAIPVKESGSYHPRSTAQVSRPQPRITNKSLLPWSLKQNPSHASTTHSGRKVSKNHMHPSQATAAEPVLTPLGFLDSYFDSPQPPKSKIEQPTKRDTSSSAVSSTINLHADKPLPKQPPGLRRPIPPRSERRHMDNTAEWPTAGVLIHDNSPPPPTRAKSVGEFQDEPVLAADGTSVRSWSTIEDDLPDEPERSPPVPPKETNDTMFSVDEAGYKPETPPKDDLPMKIDELRVHRQHLGHSLYKRWMKATRMRHRRPADIPFLIPKSMREESDTLAEDSKKPRQSSSDANDAPPQIPIGLTLPDEATSSFERALDAVISKLDAMEERRRYERKMDLEAAQQGLTNSATPQRALSTTMSPKPSTTSSELPVSDAASESMPSPEVAIEHSDKDINDRDILLGLKMAICAACDQDLDAWICNKTGLRLRRFLADLKAFDSVSQDRKTSQLLPMSRRIRRGGEENRRLQAEQQRREHKSRPWSPCFGGDGQVSSAGISKEALQDLSAE
ncbi:hypothetical protein N0V82_003763 [Gnomoniopsis sp. IMI 355080]|nr:hypothetical protein N0V82_003763 [Gnomoniopsis sp. IMI 355080]